MSQVPKQPNCGVEWVLDRTIAAVLLFDISTTTLCIVLNAASLFHSTFLTQNFFISIYLTDVQKGMYAENIGNNVVFIL